MTTPLLEAALSYLRAGLSILPCTLPDKEPAFGFLPKVKGRPKWESFAAAAATEAQVTTWFKARKPPQAIGIIGGTVSGNLEVIDIDDPALIRPWCEMVKEVDRELFDSLVVERTLRNRAHVFYRCLEPVPGCQKLAIGSLDEGHTGLIETKAEGGYVCVAPSPGYQMMRGDFDHLPTITGEQRNLLIQISRAFTRAALVEDTPAPTGKRSNADITGDRPGDEFNRTGDWRAVIEAHGWHLVKRLGDVEHWRRPGKEKGGISATWNHVPNALYVFTTSAHPLQDGKAYSPFALLTLLEYEGDFSNAARDLRVAYRGPPEWQPPKTEEPAPLTTATEPAACELLDDEDEAPEEPAPATRPPHLALVPPNANARERPAIYAGQADLSSIIDQVWAALIAHNSPPTLFHCGGSMATISRDENDQAMLRYQSAHSLRELMSRAARWFLTKPGNKKGKIDRYDAMPPLATAQTVLAGEANRLPPLNRIISAPLMAPSGSIVDAPGYHPETRTYYMGSNLKVPIIPKQPTANQIANARDFILKDLLGDFPFIEISNDPADFFCSPDRANALAMFILPFARELIKGPTPLHLIEKPSPGSGASLIFQILGSIVLGGDPVTITEATNEDEWRKRITSSLLGGPPIIAIDNLRRRLDSSALASALTVSVWGDRMLGVSENVRIPVRTMWIATGNNPAVSREISRRCISIRIDPRLEKPWERAPQSFQHPNLLQWTANHRPQLIAAILTLLRAWDVAGRPTGTASLGSFEHWANVIGGVLQVAGVQGFMENRAAFYDRSDAEASDWRALISEWWNRYGSRPMTSRDIWQLIVDVDIPIHLGKGTDHAQKILVGKQLTANIDKRFMLNDKMVLLGKGDKCRTGWHYKLTPLALDGTELPDQAGPETENDDDWYP